MFTGIVEALGTVRRLVRRGGGARLEIEASPTLLEDARLGDSIAVNGCCLTLVERGDGWWAADTVEETLRRTCLGQLQPGDPVNLERPVRLADRLGGHLVQGHVDAVGCIAERAVQADGSARVRIEVPPPLVRYMVEKGSVAVDGVSLTIVDVEQASFSVALIPHTLAVTTLGRKPVGGAVNLEVDLVAKYVERLMVPA
jgi:riboflavin synthase